MSLSYSRVSSTAEIKKKKKIFIRRFRDLGFVRFRDLGFVEASISNYIPCKFL